MEERQGAVGEIAVALGSVAPTAVRAQRAEKVLAGARPGDLCRRELAELAGEASAELAGEVPAGPGKDGPAKLAVGLAASAPACPAESAFRERLRAALMEDIAPIADIRATAEYRRRIAFRMVLHNVTELWRCFE